MARGENQKLKLMYLAKIFLEETDDDHFLSRQELIEKLNAYGINADRKTIYTDLEELKNFGLDIITEHEGNEWGYHIGDRIFELAELKLLVDSVQSSKFITERKSNSLIKKLESLVSRYEARQLHRQVLISGRVKTMNESIYYNVDKIHTAINADCRITFQYFQWNIKKEAVPRHNGALYDISPWALIWKDENYYMLGFDSDAGLLKHYRVDKMTHILVTHKKRLGKEEMKSFDLASYSGQLFGMFGGEQTLVTLEAKNPMAGVLIDRFGKNLQMVPVNSDTFRAHIHVVASGQFISWIFSLGSDVRITGPESVLEMARQEARRLSQQYLE